MTSLDIPLFRGPELKRDLEKAVELGAIKQAVENPINLRLPEYKTEEQLRDLFDVPEPTGFFGKLGLGLSEMTVAGHAIRSWQKPTFPSTNYRATQEDKEKFGYGLPEEAIERVAEDAESLDEFIYELNEARNTLRAQQRLFDGGWGTAFGVGTTLIAAGGEAVLLGGIFTKMLTSAAGSSVAMFDTLTTVSSAKSKYDRLKGLAAGVGTAAAVDIPLEYARYQLDDTLRPIDMLIGMGLATGVGAGIGAWKPSAFIPSLRFTETQIAKLGLDAARREGIQALRAGGKHAEADALQAEMDVLFPIPRPRTAPEVVTKKAEEAAEATAPAPRVLEASEPATRDVTTQVTDDVVTDLSAKLQAVEETSARLKAGMAKGDVKAEASKRGIPLTRKGGAERKLAEIRRDLRKALEAEEEELSTSLSDVKKLQEKPPEAPKPAQVVEEPFPDVPPPPPALKPRLPEEPFPDQPPPAPVETASAPRDPELDAQLQRNADDLASVEDLSKSDLQKLAARLKVATTWGPPGKQKPRKPRDIKNDIKEALKKEEEELLSTRAEPEPARQAAAVDQGELQGPPAPPEPEPMQGPPAPPEPEPMQGPQDLRDQYKPKTQEENDASIKSLADEEDQVIEDQNGNVLTVGPDYGFIDLDGEAIARQAAGEQWRIYTPGQGIRTTISNAIQAIGGRLLTPIYTRFAQSNSEFVRKFGEQFMDNPLGGLGTSLTQILKTNTERAISTLNRGLREAAALAKKNGTTLDDNMVIRAVRSEATKFDDPALDLAVQNVRKFFAEVLEHGKKHGAFFDRVKETISYFPRIWNPAKFQQMIDRIGAHAPEGATQIQRREFGRRKLLNMVTVSIMRKNKQMDPEAAKKIAERIMAYGEGPGAYRGEQAQLRHLDALRSKIVKDLEELKSAGKDPGYTAEEILEVVVPRFELEPHLQYGRHRIQLDELYGEDIGGEFFNLDEVMSNNLSYITSQYAHSTLGTAAMRQGLFGVFKSADITMGDVRTMIVKHSQDSGDSVKKAEFYGDIAELIYKMMTGQPIYSRTAMKYAQMLNAVGQSNLGWTLGFAQLPEIANIFFRTSVRAALQQFDFSEIKNVFLMGLRNGEIKEANLMSAQIEMFTGVGGDYHRFEHLLRRTDMLGVDEDLMTGFFGRGLDLARRASMLQPMGIGPMDTFLRRWASRAAFQHFLNKAYDVGTDGVVTLNKTFWENEVERFAQIGIDGEMLNRISTVLKNPQNVVVENGMLGGTVRHFNFSQAADQGAVDAFALALRRSTDMAIQRQTFGEMPAWSSTIVGKFISQFRSFSIAAKSKQLAAGIQRGDMKEATNIVAQMGLSVYGFMAITYYRSLSKPDPERYFEEATSERNLIAAAVTRNSYAGIFPALVDAAALLTTGDGLIDPRTRTTALPLDPLKGSVAFDTIYGIPRGLTALAQAMFGVRELTQSDARTIGTHAVITQIPGIQQIFETQFINTLPERSVISK